jgi:hypothetical protein
MIAFRARSLAAVSRLDKAARLAGCTRNGFINDALEAAVRAQLAEDMNGIPRKGASNTTAQYSIAISGRPRR